jgi:hypothetical protein
MLMPKPVMTNSTPPMTMSRRWTTFPHMSGRATASPTAGLSTRKPVTTFIAIATGRDCGVSEGAREDEEGGGVSSKVAMCRASVLRM